MNILTFDIEDWFHILDNESTKSPTQWGNFESRLEYSLELIFDVLNQTNQKATFFCFGYIARKHPQLVRKIIDQGYEIGSHSDLHQLVYEQSPKTFKEDLEQSLKTLEDIAGQKIRFYRAPGFSITKETPWAFDMLAEIGIEVDCSIFPAKRAHGGVIGKSLGKPFVLSRNSYEIKELPMSTLNILGTSIVFSGGGYFRVVPYRLIKYLFNQSGYNMTYFHPRDFDSNQPVLKDLSVIRRFKSYYGISSAKDKLVSLLSDFSFIDISTAVEIIDWDKAQKVHFK